jgi:hypothetical protein
VSVSYSTCEVAILLLRSIVDLGEAARLATAVLGEHGRDGSRQRRLAVVDMTDGAHVDVRLVALELLLCHFRFAPLRLSMNWVKLSNLRG